MKRGHPRSTKVSTLASKTNATTMKSKVESKLARKSVTTTKTRVRRNRRITGGSCS
jgi:hypothetical protein